MKKVAMPSPRGTNHARMFMNSPTPLGAYDAAPSGDVLDALLQLVAGKLSDAETEKFQRLIGELVEPGAADDDWAPVRSFMKSRGLSEDDFEHFRELAMPKAGGPRRMGESGDYDFALQRRKPAMDSAATRADFEKRFPDAAKIGWA